MRHAAWVLGLTLLLAGCTGPAAEIVPERFRPDLLIERAPSHWEYDVEPAMAPDFRGMGDTYPVLLIHAHHVPSVRQREQAKNTVCLAMDGSEIEVRPRIEDGSAPCMGPIADPATGRVFADHEQFRATAPLALAIRMDACSGGLVQITEKERSFKVWGSMHEFVVELAPNGTFLVDGRWIEPGTSLKIGYYVAYGSDEDEEYVRLAFEAPGEWLASRVGDGGADLDKTLPPRPAQGTGLATDVPLSPDSIADPIGLAIRATPREVTGIEALRVVHDGERMTELTLRLATSGAPVTWYGAGRTGEAMRLLGAEEDGESNDTALPFDAFLEALDLEWATLAADATEPTTLDVRLAPDVAWSTAGPASLELPVGTLPCGDGCVRTLRVASGGSSSRRDHLPRRACARCVCSPSGREPRRSRGGTPPRPTASWTLRPQQGSRSPERVDHP